MLTQLTTHASDEHHSGRACTSVCRVAARAFVSLSVLIGLGCGAYGCAGTIPTCKVPTAVELELETSDRVNRDAEGRSLPTLLRLYQVKDLSAIQMSSSEDMFENPKDTLGETLLATDELTVYPGQVMVSRFERNEQADFLIGVAIFRSPVGTAWRTIQEWPLPGDPCKEQDSAKAGPKLTDLRVRMFLDDYRIESVANFGGLPRRSCAQGDTRCADAAANAPDELPEELRHRRLRSFEEDPSRPKPTVGGSEEDK
jgi:type VI secretion system protein VasD